MKTSIAINYVFLFGNYVRMLDLHFHICGWLEITRPANTVRW